MNTAATDGKLSINFGWEGPNQWRGGWANGGLDANVIDLQFGGAKTKISVHLPDNISPSTPQRFPFLCRRVEKETQADILDVTLEQIRNVTIKVGIFEESPNQGPAIMDSRTYIITREKRIRRSDNIIKLDLPENLETCQTYSLVVTSKSTGYSFSARLVKGGLPVSTPTPAKEENSSLTTDQNELLLLVQGGLLALMGTKTMEFGIKIMTAGCNTQIRTHPNMQEQAVSLGIQVIQNEIKKIDENTLKEPMLKIRALRALLQSQSETQKKIVEKAIFKECYNTIGSWRLANMLRNQLESLVVGPISLQVRSIIEELATRFQEICLKQVN